MKGLAAAMLLMAALGCSDALAPDDALDWGAYQGTATVVDRGTTYSNVPFETPSNTATGYVQPEGFAYAGSMAATASDGVVESLTGSFEGPDGFGGEISVEFVADREF